MSFDLGGNMNFEIDIRKSSGIAAELGRERKSLESCYYTVLSVSRGNAFSGSSRQKIIRSLQTILGEMEDERKKLSQMEDCLYQVIQMYSGYEERIAKCETGIDIEWDNGQLIAVPSNPQTEKSDRTTNNSQDNQPAGLQTGDEIDFAGYVNNFFQNVIWGKPYSWLPIISITSPIAPLLYITSGIAIGKEPSFFDYSRTPSADASADWLGYEFSDDNPGVTAWLGKAEAKAQNESGYAGVNAYLGKANTELKADFAFMETGKKTDFLDDEWTESESMKYIAAEIGACATVSVLEGEAEAGLGSDMLGVEGMLEGDVGNASVEAKGKISVGEDGVDAYVEGKALVSAVEGKAEGTINILGLEITGKVGGYAGAVGVEGEIGIKDNKFVMEGGAAALIGGSIGLEIGFNDEGWDNFVDFIVFWD